MMILGLNGSPRIGGNTDILLENALSGAKDKGAKVEKVILNTLKFSPCQECENIRRVGVCQIKDDMQILYPKIEKAEAIILASPIFFGSLSAQTKMMIDRFQCVWAAKKTRPLEKKKPGAFLCVEATTRKDFFDNARSIVRNIFAVMDVALKEELLCSGVEEKGSIREHPDVLKKAFELGSRIASDGRV
ncbi:MAG: flavodoxin family protein [bacterium]